MKNLERKEETTSYEKNVERNIYIINVQGNLKLNISSLWEICSSVKVVFSYNDNDVE